MPKEIKIEKKASEVVHPATPEETREAIKQKKDLSGANLSGMSLTNLNAIGACLRKTAMEDVQLNQSLLVNPNLYRANLTRASVNNTIIINGDLVRTNLNNADLSETGIINADAEEASFQQANLRNAGIFASNLKNADFTNANLTNARIGAANVEGADFTGAETMGARAFQVDWSKASVPPFPLPEQFIQIPRWVIGIILGSLAGIAATLIYLLVKRKKRPGK